MSAPPFRPWTAAALLLVLFAPALRAANSTAEAPPAPPTERVNFDADWRFTKGDPVDAQGALAYAKIRDWVMATGSELIGPFSPHPVRPAGDPGDQVSFVQPAFDDRGWRQLNLPHDWGIEGPFEQDFPGDTGKLPWPGVGWYRKHFAIPAADAGKRIYLDIDGAMAYSAVWVDGRFVGGWPYGYASYRLDLTPYLAFGGDNVVAIRLDNPPASSRWYPGSGIYRHVWLVKTQPVHIAHWGTFVATPRVSDEAATVSVRTVLENGTSSPAKVTVATDLYALDSSGAPTGEPVARVEPAAVLVPSGHEALTVRSATVAAPRLWSPDSPALYAAVTSVTENDEKIDVSRTVFGIRTIAFDPDRGFLLNGRPLKIQGVCDHADLGSLGTAINGRALERQVDLLKEMGCNALRTSHNPPAPELLDLCDRKGLLVMDEAFDCWRTGKNPNDYHVLFDDWHERDLRALVRRDRNHPSVILWSIGNEVPDQKTPEGWRLAAQLAGIVHEEDRTRPVTSACSDTQSGYNGFQTALDVMGYNYKWLEYGRFHAVNPDIPLVGSETASAISTRGAYFFPVSDDKAQGHADFQVSSYDLSAPRWAYPPDAEFAAEGRNPFVAGEFVWTGFDYLGEPTPYNKQPAPSRSSYFGIMDLAGFKKDRFYLYQAHWRPDHPMAHLLPHWTWPERVGQVTPVFVYTSGDEAELFLNGRSLGRKQLGPFQYRLRWDDVRYEPGILSVVAYKNGKKWAEDSERTAGAAALLALAPDRDRLNADGEDLSYVTVSIRDRQGVLVPRAANRVRFEIGGPGEVAGLDNGDPTSFEPFQGSEHSAFNGLCLVIVRTRAGQPGTITLTARSDGLEPATATVVSR